MGWKPPTAYSDPSGHWESEFKAYDGDLGTWASYPGLAANAWSDILDLNREAVNCSKVRYYAKWGDYNPNIRLRAYYSDAWHDVYEGPIGTENSWQEKELGGTYSVTKLRIQLQRPDSDGWVYFTEVAFWEVEVPAGTTNPATLVADIEATLNGTVTSDGGEACEVRFQYGLTAAYGTNTAWQPGKLTDNTFSQRIDGLTPDTEYHFRAQIKNSAGTANGDDRTFTTKTFPTPFLRRVLRDVFGGGADISLSNPLEVHDPKLDLLGLTTFKQETVPATDVDGTTWKDLLDKSTITKPTKICGFKVTVAGTWTGKAQVRITDGAGNKIFPFQDYYEQDTDFTSGTQVVFNFPVVVPVADGYKFQFRSSNGADGAGETLQLNNLDVIEVG